MLGHWEAVFEHDGELASYSVPFADRTLPLVRCSIEREIDQFRRRVVAWEMASGSDGSADFRVQRLNGVRGVNQPADLRWVVEERDHLVPSAPPARCDRRIPSCQIAFLELSQSQFCSIGIHRRVDRLESSRDCFAVFVAGEIHGMAQQMDDTGLNPRLGKGSLDGLREALQPIHDGDEDVLDAPVAQVAENLGPELCALIGLKPQAQLSRAARLAR